MKKQVVTFFKNLPKILLAILKLALQAIILFILSIPKMVVTLLTNIFDNRKKIYVHLICIAYVCIFAILQTTFFTIFKPFGVTPNLMIMAIIAIALSKGPLVGGCYGIISGLIIVNIGNQQNLLLQRYN